MQPAQNEIESFLRTDLALGLANIRAHLTWASGGTRDDCRLSQEGVATIVAGLFGLERRAEALADGLSGTYRREPGLAEALRNLTFPDVA